MKPMKTYIKNRKTLHPKDNIYIFITKGCYHILDITTYQLITVRRKNNE